MSRLTIIVAATTSNGIGYQSRLPWRLSREIKYFAQVTTNSPEGHQNAVIMGRNTWESIPTKFRPLANRMNVVLSRNERYKLEPTPSDTTFTYLDKDLAAALSRLDTSIDPSNSVYRVFIIGGASLYSEALAMTWQTSNAVVDRILLTRILSPKFECDVHMPNFEGGAWKRATHSELEAWLGFQVPEGVQKENTAEYEFQMWTRDV